jgi:hypothetical protein
MKHACIALVVGAVVGTVVGAQTQATYTTYGAGTHSCGRWISADRMQALEQAYVREPLNRAVSRDIDAQFGQNMWLLGFVSGAGWTGRRMRETDAQGLSAFVDSYCATHPTQSIAEGAAALVHTLDLPGNQ